MMRLTKEQRDARDHIVYKVTSPTGEIYIGCTAKTEATHEKSVKTRFNKHVYRMRGQPNIKWRIYEEMREHGWENFRHSVLEVLSNKTEGHKRERQLIAELQPKLNTDTRGCDNTQKLAA
jgi:hypothetical protein